MLSVARPFPSRIPHRLPFACFFFIPPLFFFSFRLPEPELRPSKSEYNGSTSK